MLRPMVAMLTRLVDRFDTDETRIQKGQCMNAERRTNPWRPARKEKSRIRPRSLSPFATKLALRVTPDCDCGFAALCNLSLTLISAET